MKKLFLILAAFLLIAGGLLYYRYGDPLIKTTRSYILFTTFLKNVDERRFDEAAKVLRTDPDIFCIRNGYVFYDGSDYTEILKQARPQFWSTFNYYMDDGSTGDKFIFGCITKDDYILIRKGKIVSVHL